MANTFQLSADPGGWGGRVPLEEVEVLLLPDDGTVSGDGGGRSGNETVSMVVLMEGQNWWGAVAGKEAAVSCRIPRSDAGSSSNGWGIRKKFHRYLHD